MNRRNLKILTKVRYGFCKPISKFLSKFPPGFLSWGSLGMLFVFIALCVANDDIRKLYNNLVGGWLESTYEYLCKSTGLNIVLATAITVFGCRCIYILWRSKNFNTFISLVSLLSIIYISNWKGNYLPIIGFFSYRWLLNLLLGALIIAECRNFIRYYRRKEPKTPDQGFVVLSPEYIQDGRKSYAKTIADLLLKSPIRKKSFAIGISGEWGAGKTLVLKEIKKELKGKATVIEFKPWNSKSPDHLIDDFFSELRKGINNKHSNFGSVITKYASRIIDLNINEDLNSLAKISSIAADEFYTLDSLKKDVQKLLLSFEKNVIILVDDLDRLDSDELFETLRLIRNTADFKNVAYVATFDSNYVGEMLTNKGVINSRRYLEKIFTSTITLPSYEPHILVQLIDETLKKKYGEGTEIYNALSYYIWDKYKSDTKYILNYYIKTYRDALRFTNHLIQDFETLKNNIDKDNVDLCYENFNIREWYYLELIKFSFPEEFAKLRILPNEYLDLEINSVSVKVKLKMNIQEPDSKDKSKSLVNLLSKLFEDKDGHVASNSIIFESNYYNYFGLRVFITEISSAEFNNLIQETSINIVNVLRGWRDKTPSVKDSVTAHFANYKRHVSNRTYAFRYIEAMIEWCVLTEDDKMLSIIENISPAVYTPSLRRLVRTKFFDELKTALPKISSLKFACRLAMISASGPVEYPEITEAPDNKFLSVAKAHELAKAIFMCQVEKEPDNISVDDLIDEDSAVCTMLKYLTVINLNGIYRQVEHYIINYFVIYMNNLIKENPELKSTNLNRFIEEFNPKPEDNGGVFSSISGRHNKLYRYFGSDNDLIRHIVYNWFNASDEEKEKAFLILTMP